MSDSAKLWCVLAMFLMAGFCQWCWEPAASDAWQSMADEHAREVAACAR